METAGGFLAFVRGYVSAERRCDCPGSWLTSSASFRPGEAVVPDVINITVQSKGPLNYGRNTI